MIRIQKRKPIIDQHDKSYLYAGKFGGNFVPETLKKPIEDLTKIFNKLRKDKKFIKERDYHFKNYVGTPYLPHQTLQHISSIRRCANLCKSSK